MALMFQRLARNFIKNGYYPTDNLTLARILKALKPCDSGMMRLLDPTAGEGVALAECQQHLGKEQTQSYGIEIDEERAWHAKTLLNHCIHGDLMDCVIEKRSAGLLFLNPPYGDLSADKTGNAKTMQGRPRLEKWIYQRVVSTLQWSGVLVLIIPHYSLDKEFAEWLSEHCQRIAVYLAPEQQFKQMVIFGIRCKVSENSNFQANRQRLMRVVQGELPPVLPETWQEEPFIIPAATQSVMRFALAKLEAKQLAEIVKQSPCLWEQFETRFQSGFKPPRRPLMDLSQWHLALALAAGQVSGIVQSQDGRRLLIRGDTYKTGVESCEYLTSENGDTLEKRIVLDRFVPIIKAIDLTSGSQTFGQILTIC